MSMNAVFVQVDPDELARIEAKPELAEAIFQGGAAMPMAFGALSKKMEERVRSTGPQMLGHALANLDPELRRQLEQRLGGTAQQFASGEGGEALLKLMEELRTRVRGTMQVASKQEPRLSLEKEWHGVHYLLCGEKEPGLSLLSNAVLGGKPLGEDDEGFSGYGPARSFTSSEVAQISEALARPETEPEARARFDAAAMNKLEIYPGWRTTDAEALMKSLRELREFYASAAASGKAMITCLV